MPAQGELSSPVKETRPGSDEHYRTLLDAAFEGLVIHEAGRILEANQSFADMVGYTCQEVVTLPVSTFLEEESYAYARQHVYSHDQGVLELVCRHKDGRRFPVEVRYKQISYHGRPARVAAIRDVGDRRKVENALQRYAARLEVLHQIDRAILSAHAPADIAQAALEHLRQLIPSQRSSLALFDPGAGQAVVLAVSVDGQTSFQPGRALPIENFGSPADLQQGHPRLIDDLQAGNSPVPDGEQLLAEGIRAILTVPLMHQGVLIGCLNLGAAAPGAFSGEHAAIAREVADQLAIAIRHASLVQETERRIEELAGLHEIALAFGVMTDVHETYGALAERLAHLVNAQICIFMLLDRDTGEMRAQSPGYGISDAVLAVQRYLVEPAAKFWNFRRQGPFLVNSRDQIPSLFDPLLEASQGESVLVVPMWVEGRFIGQVVASNKPGGFTGDDARLLGVLANQAGAVIHNARLFAAIQRQLSELIALHAVALAVVDSNNEDELIERVTDIVGRALYPDAFGILLVDEAAGGLRCHPSYRGVSQAVRQMVVLPGRGITGRVAADGRSRRLDDVTREPEYAAINPGILSELCVPLKAGERILGVINAESTHPSAYSPADERLLLTFAGQLATAIERLRVKVVERRRAQQLAIIYDVGRRAAAILDLDTLLNEVVHLIVERLGLYNAVITIREGDTLHFRAGHGDYSQEVYGPPAGSTLKLGHGISGQAALTGKRLLVPDVWQFPDYVPYYRLPRVRAELAVPLRVKGEVIGVLNVKSDRVDGIGESDADIVEILADQLSIAIENARLFAGEHLAREQAEALRAANVALTQTLDLDAVLQTLLDHLALLIPYDSATVFLEAGENRLERRALRGYFPFTTPTPRFVSTTPLMRRLLANQESLLIADTQEHPEWEYRPISAHFRCWLGVPLIAGGRAIGLYSLGQQEPGFFNKTHCQLAEALAAQAAVAIENARLYSDLEEALRQEQAAREQLIQAGKLAAMGRLVASVAHELNNPLQAIQNALYLVKQENNLDRQADEDLQLAQQEVRRMAELIERLRETYRPAPPTAFQPQSLNNLAAEVQKLIATHLRHNRVAFVFEPDPALPLAPGLADQLKQVILNLSLNAVEAMPQGGRLTVRTGHQPERSEVWLAVADTGAGVAPADLPNIFDPFFTRKEGGAGLGLAISYDIIRRHQGRVEVTSELGQGTTFTVWLPLKRYDNPRSGLTE